MSPTHLAPASRAQHVTVALLLFTLCALCLAPQFARAQDKPTNEADRQRAFQLYDANNFVEAQPLLEKLVEANPNDVAALERFGYALLANSSAIKDTEARTQARQRAKGALLRARELGDNSNLLQYALDVLNSPDASEVPFSNLQGADKAMREGEQFFARGELDKAIEAYQRALQLDPHLYYAALFTGDSYFKQKQYDKAGEWFARAIAINPDIETAYRYWGDALVAQDKRDAARDKFIEAIVATPYSRNTYVGLTQWAQRYKVNLAHPKIDVPTNVSPMKDNQMTITIDPKALGSTDGASAWTLYGLARAAWTTNNYERFRKQYPNEKVYRHSLAEEADALRMVVDDVKQQMKDGKIKRLDPSLANLVKLSDAGLLEAYILFVRIDEGIAQDYVEYRKANRDKLRRYWQEFVVGNNN
jgi:tetratricopeptide (TPR) repeat protein